MNQSQRNPTNTQILIVDDMPDNLDMLSRTLESEEYKILAAPSGEVALRIAAHVQPDLILLDIMMPTLDGFETCRRLKADVRLSKIPVIFITAKNEAESIVEGFEVGGVDYITKPFRQAEVLARVRTHLRMSQLTGELREKNSELTASNEKLRAEIKTRVQAEQERDVAKAEKQTAEGQLSLISQREAERWGISGFIGQSQTIREILVDVRRLQATRTTTVLITGESGTGKELIARAIHFGGTRANRPFIPVNCAAIPAELAESLFFGHVEGTFTGATSDRKGYFELADGGTLFLDEIGEMPPQLQAKLLRVLEDGSFMPLGGIREKRVDIRILAATNADLQAKIASGKLREDLYFRLAGFIVTIPPLRERQADIPLLANHFLAMFAAEMAIEAPALTEAALKAFASYDFPGNVRELKNIIERALIESGAEEIHLEHLHFINLSPSSATATSSSLPVEVRNALVHPEQSLSEQVADYERRVILNALDQTQDQQAAAAILGIPEATLRYKMDKYRIRRSRMRMNRRNLR